MSKIDFSIYNKLFDFCMTNEYHFEDVKSLQQEFNIDEEYIQNMISLSKFIKNVKGEAKENIEHKYTDLLYDYKEILNQTSVLAQELNLNTSYELSILYTYLLWNGYFSQNCQMKYDMEKRLILCGLDSLSIMTGYGICLNFSNMLKDFLNHCGFDSAVISSNRMFWKNELMDHVFTLIKDNDKFYIFDSTNVLSLEPKKIDQAKIVVGKKIFKHKYKLYPYNSYYLNFDSKSIETLDDFRTTTDFESPYSKKDYLMTQKRCLELLQNNEHLLNNYYFTVRENIDYIANKVLLKK